jgi:hypothetical protein
MKLVAESFSWPFRGNWRSVWPVGVLTVLFVPVLFIPLLGYAIAATREAERDPSHGPPPWRLSGRLLADGLWTSLAVGLLTVPFALVLNPLAGLLFDGHVWRSSDAAVSQLNVHVLALFALALPWGLLLLLVMPHSTSRFAASGRPLDLFDFASSVRGVVSGFATWNLAAAAIVTGWATGLACAGLFCIGLVPGVFYAILVSAHASAALHGQVANPPAR